MISIGVALALYFLILEVLIISQVTRAIISWDAGAALYLLLAIIMMFKSDHNTMQARALALDEGKFTILIVVVLAVIFALGSIVAELANVKDLESSLRYSHVILAVLTILISWFFTHTMFALHYAHEYYGTSSRGKPSGLIFPGNDKPDYADFIYFSYIIGTSAQTAGIGFSNKLMRRIGLAHCVLAFFFNTSLLALTINIVSGLI
jgi:uncharacterized membrane protein